MIDARRSMTRRCSASSGRHSRPRYRRRPRTRRRGRRSGPTSPPTSAAAARCGSPRRRCRLAARDDAQERRVAGHRLAYVRPEARRKGVLHALMREALAEGRARGATRITLDVLTANEPAVAAWRRLGFEPFSYAMAAPVDAVRVGDDAAAVLGRRVCPDRRPRRRRAGGRQVPATDWPLRVDERRPAPQRLDEGRRRALQSRPEGAAPARPRALAGDGQHRAHARDRGGRRRPLHPLGSRRDRRRVRIRSGALRPAPARRRRRPRREPDGCAAADRRRPRPAARRRAYRGSRSTSSRRRRSSTPGWPRCWG